MLWYRKRELFRDFEELVSMARCNDDDEDREIFIDALVSFVRELLSEVLNESSFTLHRKGD